MVAASSLGTVVNAHYERAIGRTGLREVEMSVFYDGEIEVSYRMLHAWKRGKNGCSSLYYLLSPKAMMRSAVLSIEGAQEAELKVWLKLRTSIRVLKLSPRLTRQCFLGTDFTYDDMRFWLAPLDPSNTTVTTDCASKHNIVTCCEKGGVPCNKCREIRIDRATNVVTEIRWFREDHEKLDRIYTARDLVVIAGIVTPTKMEVALPDEGYKTTMTLNRCCQDFSDGLRFEPGALSSLQYEDFVGSNNPDSIWQWTA